MYKFVGSFSFIGFFIPTVVMAGSYFLPHDRTLFIYEIGAQFILFCLWPSSFMLMADQGSSVSGTIFIVTISTVVNIFLYTFVGYLFWLGKFKYRWILYATGFLVISFWSWLFKNSF